MATVRLVLAWGRWLSLSAVPYGVEDAREWDAFLADSVSPTLLFRRGFMDYHSDRFVDASIVVRDASGIAAIFPASRDSFLLTSHGGLTYGGLVWRRGLHTARVLEIASLLVSLWHSGGVRNVIWKVMPRHYQVSSSDADLYALFRLGAVLHGRGLSTVWPPGDRDRFTAAKRRNARGAGRKGVAIAEVGDPGPVHELVRAGLAGKYDLTPTHSLEELALLRSRFPESIRIIEARAQGAVVGGAVIFQSPRVDHVQYLAGSPAGRQLRAQDALMECLYDAAMERSAFLDLGVSTEEGGRYLNGPLMAFKEEFGGHPAVYDAYSIDTARAVALASAF
jgi:hypothetical protein